MSSITLVAIAVVLALVAIYRFLSARSSIPHGLQRLPGPKGLPFLGSVHELPEELSWIKFHEWGEKYGPIYQVNLAGANHVWISNDRIAHELLSKRASIYSDRPHIPALISDNRDSGQYLPLMSRNALWSRQRKFAGQIMRASERNNFQHHPELEAIRLCHELLREPTRYNLHLESFISRVTCRLAWGHSEASDELKQRARELLIGVSPTGSLLNKLPFLMSLPDWLSPAKAWERRRANTEMSFFQHLQGQVREEMNEKIAPHSWMKMFLDDHHQHGFASSLEGAYAVGMHGIAGALTIAAVMQTFCLAMVHHPKYLSMLQEEVDRVCGDRLPTNADNASLPFLRAVIRECFRWRPPVPTGIPHYLSEDDEYEGYFIPKGSIIHPLEWSISRDPNIYPNPEDFNPLRWIEPQYPTYQEPQSRFPTILNCSQFGYGHRTCLGQTVTEADLIVGIGSLAWSFDLQQVEEEPSRTSTSKLKTSISHEELNAGFPDYHLTSTENPIQQQQPLDPSSLNDNGNPANSKTNRNPNKPPKSKPKTKKPKDQTLNYTTLLIAKPNPFDFSLKPRTEKKAAYIETVFDEKDAEGCFPDAKDYWTIHS